MFLYTRSDENETEWRVSNRPDVRGGLRLANDVVGDADVRVVTRVWRNTARVAAETPRDLEGVVAVVRPAIGRRRDIAASIYDT